MSREHFADRRKKMVQRQIALRGVEDPRVLEAMSTVPREAFVAKSMERYAYRDSPLPIEAGQTLSQPFIVAMMAEALSLRPEDRVLEVGTGSGYASAILSHLAKEVFTVERHHVLVELATRRLAALGYHNVEVLHGDGTLGWPEHAPFNAIVVAAGGPEIPPALLEQLAEGGRLVIPVGAVSGIQRLRRYIRNGNTYPNEDLGAVSFVPLVKEPI